MPKSFVSPYGITLREGGRVDVFPAAEVFFRNAEGELFSLFLIIDSGAAISALPKSDATVLGIEPKRGIARTVSGIGQEPIAGWQHELAVHIGGSAVRLPILFLEYETGPRVLGRAGVFEHFIVIFDEQLRQTGCIDERSRESRAIRGLFKKL